MDKIDIPIFQYNGWRAHPDSITFKQPYGCNGLNCKDRIYRFNTNFDFVLITQVLPDGIEVVYESSTNKFHKIIPQCDINNAIFLVVYDYDKEMETSMMIQVEKKEYLLR